MVVRVVTARAVFAPAARRRTQHGPSRNGGWFSLTATADLAGNRQNVVFLGCPSSPIRLHLHAAMPEIAWMPAWPTIRRAGAFEKARWVAPPCGKGKTGPPRFRSPSPDSRPSRATGGCLGAEGQDGSAPLHHDPFSSHLVSVGEGPERIGRVVARTRIGALGQHDTAGQVGGEPVHQSTVPDFSERLPPHCDRPQPANPVLPEQGTYTAGGLRRSCCYPPKACLSWPQSGS